MDKLSRVTALNYQTNSDRLPEQQGMRPANEVTMHQQMRKLEHEVKRLRLENSDLRKRLHENAVPSRIARQAGDDAMLFVRDLMAGLLVSQIAMEVRHGLQQALATVMGDDDVAELHLASLPTAAGAPRSVAMRATARPMPAS